MDWQKAKVIKTLKVAEDIKSITIAPEKWISHKAGQHYDLRIVGTDVSRKYSVVSSPQKKGKLEFGVQLFENGILSPKLWQLKEGDQLEVRGPWGESFVWEDSMDDPILLIGAGSGITPLLSIYESHRNLCSDKEVVFILSAKSKERIMHFDNLKEILITRLTESEPRIDLEFLKEKAGHLTNNPKTRAYICGPEGFIDSIVDYLVDLGVLAKNIRSEEFI